MLNILPLNQSSSSHLSRTRPQTPIQLSWMRPAAFALTTWVAMCGSRWLGSNWASAFWSWKEKYQSFKLSQGRNIATSLGTCLRTMSPRTKPSWLCSKLICLNFSDKIIRQVAYFRQLVGSSLIPFQRSYLRDFRTGDWKNTTFLKKTSFNTQRGTWQTKLSWAPTSSCVWPTHKCSWPMVMNCRVAAMLQQ